MQSEDWDSTGRYIERIESEVDELEGHLRLCTDADFTMDDHGKLSIELNNEEAILAQYIVSVRTLTNSLKEKLKHCFDG